MQVCAYLPDPAALGCDQFAISPELILIVATAVAPLALCPLSTHGVAGMPDNASTSKGFCPPTEWSLIDRVRAEGIEGARPYLAKLLTQYRRRHLLLRGVAVHHEQLDRRELRRRD